MKNKKIAKVIGVFCLIMTIASNIVFGADIVKSNGKGVNENVIFKAKRMAPWGMSMSLLTLDTYSIDFNADSVNSYLPYYGQGTFPYGSPLDFVKNNVSYELDTLASGKHYRLTTTYLHDRNLRKMVLDYYADGNANLQVYMMNYQPISFEGNVIQK